LKIPRKRTFFFGSLAALIAALFLLWNYLPSIVDLGIRKFAEVGGFYQTDLRVDQVNLRGTKLKDVEIQSNEGNLTVKSIDLLYEPADLLEGRANALSLTNPALELDLPALEEWLGQHSDDSDENQTLQEKLSTTLESPLVRFIRLRNGTVELTDKIKTMGGKVTLEADLYKNLAQVRMDGNFSGFPFDAEVTSVLEDTNLLISSRLELADLGKLVPFLESLPIMPGSIPPMTQYGQIEQGRGGIYWTGRVMGDNIIDQFIELNASDTLVQAFGFSVAIPKALLFFTPNSMHNWEANLYANLNWGENMVVHGMNIRMSMDDGRLGLNSRIREIKCSGILPEAELLGFSVDTIEFSSNEDGELIGIERIDARFSALHLESGMFNLYDGKLSLKWLGESRFHIDLIKANASIPTMGINFQDLSYSGEVNLETLPVISKPQTFTARGLFIGEDSKIEDVSISFSLNEPNRANFSRIEFKADNFECSIDPANLTIEFPEAKTDALTAILMDSEVRLHDGEDYLLENINGNLKFSSLDPLETNGSQKISFDMEGAGRRFPGGEISFEVLQSGEKVLNSAEIGAFGGSFSIGSLVMGEAFDEMEINLMADNLIAQDILDVFEDLDAQMVGSLSGRIALRMRRDSSWDFYGGFLSLNESDIAHLSLKMDGALTDGLNPEGSEYKNMELLEKALADLDLESLKINFKLMDDGERVVDMNVIGESMVDGKKISVDYRPRIIGGLDALLQQLDLSAFKNF
jgi:hypothetical protein